MGDSDEKFIKIKANRYNIFLIVMFNYHIRCFEQGLCWPSYNSTTLHLRHLIYHLRHLIYQRRNWCLYSTFSSVALWHLIPKSCILMLVFNMFIYPSSFSYPKSVGLRDFGRDSQRHWLPFSTSESCVVCKRSTMCHKVGCALITHKIKLLLQAY